LSAIRLTDFNSHSIHGIRTTGKSTNSSSLGVASEVDIVGGSCNGASWQDRGGHGS
jgi:hypothetical protein